MKYRNQLQRAICVIPVLLCATAYSFSSGGFWETREPGAWTAAEVRRISGSSPWAKVARTEFVPGPGARMGEMIGTSTRDSLSATQKGINNPSAAGVRDIWVRAPKAGGVVFSGEAVIRWESAAPIAAVAKAPLPAEFAGHYVITVSGLPQEMLERVVERGIGPFQGTNLRVKGRPEIPMEYLFLSKDKQTLGFAIEAAKLPLSSADGTATFTMTCENLRLRAAFDLQTMTYRGKLAL